MASDGLLHAGLSVNVFELDHAFGVGLGLIRVAYGVGFSVRAICHESLWHGLGLYTNLG